MAVIPGRLQSIMVDGVNFKVYYDPFEGKSVCHKCENLKESKGLNDKTYYCCKIKESEEVTDYIIGKQYTLKKQVSYKEKNKDGDCEDYFLKIPEDPIGKIKHFFATRVKDEIDDLSDRLDGHLTMGKIELACDLTFHTLNMKADLQPNIERMKYDIYNLGYQFAEFDIKKRTVTQILLDKFIGVQAPNFKWLDFEDHIYLQEPVEIDIIRGSEVFKEDIDRELDIDLLRPGFIAGP